MASRTRNKAQHYKFQELSRTTRKSRLERAGRWRYSQSGPSLRNASMFLSIPQNPGLRLGKWPWSLVIYLIMREQLNLSPRVLAWHLRPRQTHKRAFHKTATLTYRPGVNLGQEKAARSQRISLGPSTT